MMSTLAITAAELASEDWQLVEADATKPICLVVQLRRYVHVLPYFRFVYAEGDNARVTIAFSSHLVAVTGHGLAALLAALAGQIVVRIVQPSENESKFSVRGIGSAKPHGPIITGITVEEFK